MLNKRFILFLVLISSLIVSCEKDNKEKLLIDEEAYAVNQFVWSYMDYFYLWKDNMPQDIDYSREESSVEYFYKLRYNGTAENYDPKIDENRDGDRWSFITDDLQGLLAYYDGDRHSMGYKLYGYYIDDSETNLALFVAYVYEGSPAAGVNLQRGSIITKLNGEDITEGNANEILSQSSYEITLGTIEDSKIISTDQTYTLTKSDFDLKPIIKSEVYEINGKKIAYLLYNHFLSGSEVELVAEFESYKAAGVDELVLDLRYNGGGSVLTSTNLASMLVPPSNIGDVYSRKLYNDDLQKEFLDHPDFGEDYLSIKFSDKLQGIEGHESILPNLNLSKLYVLTLDYTASSSEILINGLAPYMDVVLIGEKTYGKYVASTFSTHDEYENWAIQPIIYRSSNSLGVTDYWDGFNTDIVMADYPELGDFGYNVELSTGEPMLSIAIDDILGTQAKKSRFSSKYKRKKIDKVDEIDRTMFDKSVSSDLKLLSAK